MNTFKRKFAMLLTAAFAAVFLSACPSNDALVRAQADAAIAAGNARVEEAKAATQEAIAVQKLADKIDATGASNYLLVKALKGLGLGQPAPQQVVVQQPQSLFGLAWQALLQVADIGLRGYGIKAGRDVAITQSNNATALGISTNGTFASMGGSIERAGIAGYPYVQAPAANITNTLSGTGVLGSGSYAAPVTTTTTTTTTRNCQGGSGAPGGGGTTGAAGSGGGAQGGTC